MIDKNETQIAKTISYNLQIIDSSKFMTSLLSNRLNNLAQVIYKIKWKYGHKDKKCEICEMENKDDLIKYKCL